MPYAALTAAAPANPETSLHPPPIATKPRGNPNLGLAPTQPARGLDPRGTHTRRGCPRRSPTIDSKLRCCMHGGRSPVRARPRAYPGGGPGAVSGCATPTSSMAATVPTRTPTTATASP
jgi:hypothetical protein